MRRSIYLLGGCLFVSFNVLATAPNTPPHEASISRIDHHVHYFCAKKLAGRLTGTPGEKLATHYIANYFARLGLKPAGDHGTFFNEFSFSSGVRLGRKNFLSLINQHGISTPLRLNSEWRPLPFSDSAVFKKQTFVAAGYGITAPARANVSAYDSYQHLSVKNKWVLIFSGLPAHLSTERMHQLSPYAALRYKIFTAKKHGAIGIIFVNERHAKMNSLWLTQSSHLNAGLVVLAVSHPVFNHFFNHPLQHMTLSGQTDLKKIIRHGRNVIGKLNVGENNQPLIIIGAHIDHLGHGELTGSRASGNEIGRIHPGADDNASGVASLLEAATALSHLQTSGKLPGNKSILFAAWSGEELGVLGSAHFVAHIGQPRLQQTILDAAINLDMVGHLRKKLILQGIGSSPDWRPLIKKIHPSLPLVLQRDPYLPTDSLSFYLKGVPSVNIFTGAHDNYHTPRDTPDTLNYRGIKKVSDFLVDLVYALETTPKLTYQTIPKPREQPEQEFKIYLGTIPDYTSSDLIGVKLSGIAKNSPAAIAGMKQGDVIIQLAGQPIHDIYDYTFVLNSLTVGKATRLMVRRGRATIPLHIFARYRS